MLFRSKQQILHLRRVKKSLARSDSFIKKHFFVLNMKVLQDFVRKMKNENTLFYFSAQKQKKQSKINRGYH